MLESRYDMHDLEHRAKEHQEQANSSIDFHAVAKAVRPPVSRRAWVGPLLRLVV